jgi:VWFA-related protein
VKVRQLLALGTLALVELTSDSFHVSAQNQLPPPRFRAGVELVLLDVAVLDRNRVPVRGLRASDFTVLEDGMPRRIASFDEISVPEPDGALVPWMREVAPDVRTNTGEDRRVVLIVLDDATVSFRSIDRVKKIGSAIVDRLGPADAASIVYTAANNKSQEYTSDRARLRAAVDRFTDTAVAGLEQRYSLATLSSALDYLADLPQYRKAVIFVSGLQLDLVAPAGATDITQLGAPENAATQRDRRYDMEEVFQKAQRANISLYPINPNGLEVTADGPDLTVETLLTLANNTGGFAVVNSNSFTSQIGQIFRETGSYYLLGIEAAHTDGRLRKVDVRVNRSGLIVRTRSGYVAPKPDKKNATSKPSAESTNLVKAMAGVLPTNDMPMRVDVAPFATALGDRAAMAIIVGLRETVPADTPRIVENVELLATAFTQKYRLEGSRRLTAQLTLRSTGEEARYEVLSRLDLKPGHYMLRFAAHNSTSGKSGSVYHDIEIPEFSKEPVSLSGVLVSVSPSLTAVPKDFLADLVPVSPTTQRVFYRDVHKPTAFVRVYEPSKASGGVRLASTIVNDRDVRVFQRVDPIELSVLGKTRFADYQLSIPVSTLPPGSYLLTLEASDGSHSAKRQVRFEIR